MNISIDSTISHRKVWMLAGPIIISNISVPLVGAVDTAVVGRLPEPQAMGAVALGALIFSFLFWGFGFLRMGTTGFVARALGANDQQALSDTLLRVLLLALILGFLIILLSHPVIGFALYLLESSVAVEQLTASYAGIRIWSAPATLLIYVFTGVFIGMHSTGKAFVLQLILNISNMLLDILFVIGFDMGVEGVALATIIAEYLAVFCGFILLHQPLMTAIKQFDWQRLVERKALVELMSASGNPVPSIAARSAPCRLAKYLIVPATAPERLHTDPRATLTDSPLAVCSSMTNAKDATSAKTLWNCLSVRDVALGNLAGSGTSSVR